MIEGDSCMMKKVARVGELQRKQVGLAYCWSAVVYLGFGWFLFLLPAAFAVVRGQAAHSVPLQAVHPAMGRLEPYSVTAEKTHARIAKFAQRDEKKVIASEVQAKSSEHVAKAKELETKMQNASTVSEKKDHLYDLNENAMKHSELEGQVVDKLSESRDISTHKTGPYSDH